jgi:micrococcal nuclease
MNRAWNEEEAAYVYKGDVIKVVDGDTVDILVDLGFSITTLIRFRLCGINAPETRGVERPEGVKAKRFLKNKIDGKEVIVRTYQDRTGKYGRYLADIYIDEENVNELMIKKGHAERMEK